MRTPFVDRAFVRIDEGLVHYRHIAGEADGRLPLVMLHASPGSSRGLEPLMRELARADPGRRIVAPDSLGNGDSAAPAAVNPDIAYFAGGVGRALDALGITRAIVFGSHTGARVACEFGILYPERVTAIVFDGIGDYDDAMRSLLLREYAPEVAPDDYGRHLLWAFNFVRDQALHYPYFMRDPEHRLMSRPVASADELHWRVVEVLKSITSYHKSYRAAFAYRASERLPLLEVPNYFLDSEDELPTLRAMLEQLSTKSGGVRIASAAGVGGKSEAISRCLACMNL